MHKTRIFSNILRFIDHLFAFNNDKFKNNYGDIYPDELELTKENEGHCKISFFDKRPQQKLMSHLSQYTLPYYLDSNIPSKIFYVSIGSDILRIARKATDLINMVTSVALFLYG